MTAFKLTAAPAAEPVTLDKAKAQARIDTNVDDALITGDTLHRAKLSVTDEVFSACNFSGADLLQEFDCLTANIKTHFGLVPQSS